jgi:hypothetical protein
VPILGLFPVADRPVDLTNPFDESRQLGFRNLDGSASLEFTGAEVIALWGAQGLDVPDRVYTEGTVSGVDGTFLDAVRIGSRKVTLPIFLASNSGHLPFLRQRSYLRSFFNHRGVDLAANDGSFDLVASSIMGERTLRCAYESGMSGDLAQDAGGSYWERVSLTFVAPRTYWYGDRWATPTIRTPAGTSFFGGFPPGISSSRAFGVGVPVVVAGDVQSWPRLDVTGPCTSLLVEAPGLHISIPAGLALGEKAVIDTDPRKRRIGGAVTFNGVEDWSRLLPDDKWAPLQPGLQFIDLVLTGATAATTAVVSGDTRFETPW